MPLPPALEERRELLEKILRVTVERVLEALGSGEPTLFRFALPSLLAPPEGGEKPRRFVLDCAFRIEEFAPPKGLKLSLPTVCWGCGRHLGMVEVPFGYPKSFRFGMEEACQNALDRVREIDYRREMTVQDELEKGLA